MRRTDHATRREHWREDWRDSSAWGVFLIAAYTVTACLPLAVAWLLSPQTGASVWRELARGTALLACGLLGLQFVLASRLRLITRPFGLDMVMAFHRAMAVVAIVLVLCHPLLLLVDTGDLSLLRLDTPWTIWLGKVALVLLLIIGAASLLFHQLPIGYQKWRLAHRTVVLVVALGFAHGLLVGGDLVGNLPMQTLWWLLLAAVLLIVLYRNVHMPLWGRRRFEVSSVQPASHDTFTIGLKPVDDKAFTHLPGQFWFLKILREDAPSEEHSFTISSSPTGEPPLSSTIRQSGDYTATIARTRPGQTALVEGPYGRFSFLHQEPKAILFVAGGVGITPILSMLRYLRDTGDQRPVLLLYANSSAADIIAREELAALPRNVRVVHVLSQPPADWSGPRGHIDRELIHGQARDLLTNAHAYLCGPRGLVRAVAGDLRALGMHPTRIHQERFSLI